MTARANSLTARVTKPSRRVGTAWTAPASDLRVMIAALGRLGYDGDRLLASVGGMDVDLDDPDARIPCEAFGTLLSCAQRERFTPNIALEIARMTPIGAYPLLDYLVLTSDTVDAGVRQLAHYFRLVGNPVTITLDEQTDPIRIDIASGAPFGLEYTASLLILHFRNETDGRFAAADVSFQHVPDDAAGFERALGCKVRPGASWNGVSVRRDAWRLPLRRRDPVLRHMLEAQANDILSRLPTHTGLALEVQRALTARVTRGDARIGTLARQLGMSGRTLQRRLAAEGVSYQALLEDARKEAAGRYISESTLAIGEVAYLVGYSEPAPFHRAFKRWFGTTPEGFRQKRRHG
jgi:AraC-like DNA-binding protein